MSEKIREKYVNRFYDFLWSLPYDRKKNQIDVWVFLDAVLDGSFKELKTSIALPSSELPDDMLVPTILKWSPLVEKLSINCSPIDVGYHAIDGTLAELTSTIRKLNSLQHLKQLCLHSIGDEQRFIMLSLIGTACPNLSHLGVFGINMGMNDILALIIGEDINNLLDLNNYYEQRNLIPSWCEDGSLEHLQLPCKYVTPTCSTLRELQLYYYTRSRYDDEEAYNEIGASVAALALRHIPLLQVVDKRFPASLAITKLHNNNVAEEEKSREKFQRAIQEASERSGNTSPLQNLKATNFTGMFYLTKLDFVNVKYEAMLRAIGQTCPLLKEVTFCDLSFASDEHAFTSALMAHSYLAIQLENVTDPWNLRVLFNGWPKLTKIGFHQVSLRYITVILEEFGAGLQQLEFKHCDEIKLDDLALCQQLKSLRIGSCFPTLLPEKFESRFDSSKFLPQLKIFKSDGCLGRTSRLFEGKSNLVSLVMNCFHGDIELERREPHQKRSKHSAQTNSCFGLSKIRQLWSQLEVLKIKQFIGLSMAVVSDSIPHLRKLKLITLPRSSYDPAPFKSMRGLLLERNPPAQIHLNKYICYSCKMFRPDELGHH